MPQVDLSDPKTFSAVLFEQMQRAYPCVAELELYEFCYCLETVTPPDGWEVVELEPMERIERKINDRQFYHSIQLKPQRNGRTVMDEQILCLLRMLFVGLATGAYPPDWITRRFYFDLRGFYFLPRTQYYQPAIRAHLGDRPYRKFEPKQKQFELEQSIGYKAFKEANLEVDRCFIELIQTLVRIKGTPIMIAIAGQTAAGKTEIVARLREAFGQDGKKVTAVELDNFFTDREEREARGIDSLGKDALHYGLLLQCLGDLRAGRIVFTPRYNFIDGISSHDLRGQLKPGCAPVEIDPADIIFIEGNFPFLLPEVATLVGIKVVYLTDDAIRLKRKWRRDIDFRRKYERMYFLNRFFREQFLMAESVYRPQMLLCDLLVDTTRAEIWATPMIQAALSEAGGL